MKKILGVMIAAIFCSTCLAQTALFAEESTDASVSEAVTAPVTTTVKEELAADKQKIAVEKNEMKANAQAARAAEKDLRAQINAARAAGDIEKVKSLQAQLKTMHQANVQKMHKDKKDMLSAKKELRHDKKVAAHSKRPS